MRFKVMILEDKPDGAGVGCWGTIAMTDEIWERVPTQKVIELCCTELGYLFSDMFHVMKPEMKA